MWVATFKFNPFAIKSFSEYKSALQIADGKASPKAKCGEEFSSNKVFPKIKLD